MIWEDGSQNVVYLNELKPVQQNVKLRMDESENTTQNKVVLWFFGGFIGGGKYIILIYQMMKI